MCYAEQSGTCVCWNLHLNHSKYRYESLKVMLQIYLVRGVHVVTLASVSKTSKCSRLKFKCDLREYVARRLFPVYNMMLGL